MPVELGPYNIQQKMFTHFEKIQKWNKGEKVFPVLVELDPSLSCNHKCRWCIYNYTKPSIMPRNLLLKVTKEICGLGVNAIMYSGGGEPLMSKDIGEVINIVKDHGLDQGMHTNGALLTDKLIEKIVDTHTWIRISLDAATAKTHSLIHGCPTADFQKIISNIKKLAKRKEESGSKITIGAGMVVCRDNANEIDLAAKSGAGWGLGYFHFKPEYVFMNLRINREWWFDDIFPAIEKSGKYSTDDYQVVGDAKFTEVTKVDENYGRYYEKCHGSNFIGVIADSKVWFCTWHIGRKGYDIGDLNKNTFKEIWLSKRKEELENNLDFRDCAYACKNHEINKVLFKIKHPETVPHRNFL